MLTINPSAQALTEEENKRLSPLATANICDAFAVLNLPRGGCLEAGIKPLLPTQRIQGVALTVLSPGGSSLAVQCGLTLSQPGYVLIVDTESYTKGPFLGDLNASVGQLAGLSGIVIDGFIRDSETIKATGFPVFSKGFMPRKPTTAEVGTVNGNIICGGITVEPGDIIVGDGDGVVSIPRECLDEVLQEAEAKLAKDEERQERIKAFFQANEYNKAGKDMATLFAKGVSKVMNK